MNHKSILVISNKWDAHADAFIKAMHNYKTPIVRINTEDFRKNSIKISIDENDFTWSITTPENRIITDKMISGVYIRRMSMSIDVADIDVSFQEFSRKETHIILDSIGTLLEQKKWLNKTYVREQANNKVRQLMIANRIGFTLPRTLITNQPLDALMFCTNIDSAIYKTLHIPIINFPDDRQSIINTSIVSSCANFSAVIHTPALFQRYINKQYELRIHVIDDVIIPVRIHSQNAKKTRIDWRVAQGNLECDIVNIPQDIQTKIQLFMLELDLKFGIIDMIVTEGGDYVFLEINPDGNWLWLPPNIHPLITEAIVSYFL